MSRRHRARVEGSASVEMVCDNCGKTQWKVVAIKECCDCAEWAGVSDRSGWHYTDDCLVCSDECARTIFEWDDEPIEVGVEWSAAKRSHP